MRANGMCANGEKGALMNMSLDRNVRKATGTRGGRLYSLRVHFAAELPGHSVGQVST